MADFILKHGLKGLKVVVTGGSKGIGRSIVEEFAKAGAQILYTYRRDDESVETLSNWSRTKNYDVMSLKNDASLPTSSNQLKKTIEQEFGSLDVLINNVGDALERSSLENSTDELWTDTLNVNLFSAVRNTRACIPALRLSKNGIIINVSSIAARTSGGGDSLHYGAAKAALNTFTKGLAIELKEDKIRAMGVAPSAISTDFQKRHSSPERLQRIVDQTPAGRIGSPEEVASLVLYLASPSASFLNGETIFMTGGR